MVTNFHYDALGRNTYEALPGTGRVTRSTYDAVGNLKTVTNPNLQVTAYGYDNLNRRISETDAAAQTATTAYDLVGNVVQVVDRNNNVTNFTYTKLNQLRTEAKSGLSGTRTYEYNRLGGVTKYTDRDGRVIDTTFDRLNRPVGETWRLSAGGTVQNTLARQFNNAGQLENVQDNSSAIDFDYGDFGWQTSESNFIDDCLVVSGCPAVVYTPGIPATTIWLAYDNYGNRATANDSFDGTGQAVYDRDEAQRLTGIDRTVVNGSLNYTYGIDLTYDAADRLTGTTRTYTNANAAEYPTQPATTLAYQTLTKRLGSIQFTQPVGGFTESLAYDAADRLDSMTDQQGLHDYTFNGTDQLTAVDHPGAIADESFTLDVNGNRLNEMATTDAGVTSFANGRHNQLPLGNGAGGANNANNFDYLYDNEGHLKGAFDDANDKYYEFFHDNRGRLTRVNRRNGVNDDAPIEHQTIYTYDALDRRIKKSVAGVVEEFVYDGDNLYLEFTGAGTTPAHRYQYADSVDAILADENLTVASGVVDWYQTDHEGSVRTVVRASDGALKNSLTYSAFGQLTESVPAFDQHFSYTGRELDEATGPNGLYYYRGRYYDAKLGRFLQQDPSGFSGGDVNLYRYVNNNPVQLTDPFGLAAQLALGMSEWTSASGADYDRFMPSWTLDTGAVDFRNLLRDPGAILSASNADRQSRLEDQAVAMAGASFASMMANTLDAPPSSEDYAEFIRAHQYASQTRIAAVPSSWGTVGLDDALKSARSVEQKMAVMRRFAESHQTYLQIREEERANAGWGGWAANTLRDAMSMEYGYGYTVLFADGHVEYDMGAEPATGDIAGALLFWTQVGNVNSVRSFGTALAKESREEIFGAAWTEATELPFLNPMSLRRGQDSLARANGGVSAAPSSVTNWRGDPVRIPDGHIMSPRDPAISAAPIIESGPFTTAQRTAMLSGKSGGTRISPHHRHQIPAAHGGVIDELPGPGHPSGNTHTGGSPSRHPSPSIFNSMEGGKALRQSEIKSHWQAKGQRLLEVESGVWIDPGF